MSHSPTVFALGRLDHNDTAQVTLLREIAKAPLGWRGEFPIRYLITPTDRTALPIGVSMYIESGVEWRQAIKKGDLVILPSQHSDPATIGRGDSALIQELAAMGVLMLAPESHPIFEYLSPGTDAVSFRDAEDAVGKIYELIGAPHAVATISSAAESRSRALGGVGAQGVVRSPERPITVLHIIEAAGLGGAMRALLGIVRYLGPRYRHRLLSLAPHKVDAAAEPLLRELSITHVASADRAVINGEIRNADIVQAHWWNNPELLDLLSGDDIPEGRFAGWLHVGGHLPPQAITTEVIDVFDVAIACSPFTYEAPAFLSLDEETKSTRTAMIYGPADFGRLKGFKAQPHDGFTVGYIGTVDFLKMHPDYASLCARVKIPSARFVVGGSGRAESVLRAQFHEHGIGNRLELLGYVHDVRPVLERLDVFGYPLCPETYAGSELTLQEVMYAGIPPVVFGYGGVKRLVLNEFTGIVVSSAREYAEAIEYLYHRPDERARLGANAHHYAEQIFGAERAAVKFDALYQRLLLQPKRQRRFGHLRSSSIRDLIERRYGVPRSAASVGAARFIQSIGEEASPPFTGSILADTPDEQMAYDQEIAQSSELMRSAGVLPFARYHTNDPYLQLWAAICTLREGRYEEALFYASGSFNAGLQEPRAIWYMAQAAVGLNRVPLAQQLLEKLTEIAPSFAPARELHTKLRLAQ